MKWEDDENLELRKRFDPYIRDGICHPSNCQHCATADFYRDCMALRIIKATIMMNRHKPEVLDALEEEFIAQVG